jgi:histidinol-phosphate aminotransferase
VPFHLNEIRRATIAPARNIGDIEPYRLTTSQATSDAASLKLDWNEGLPPPPAVVERIQQATAAGHTLNWYPDSAARTLRDAIARYVGTPADHLEVFVGSDGAFDYIARTFVDATETAAIIGPTYDQVRVSVQSTGARCQFVYGEDPFAPSLDEVIDRIETDPKLIYLANPNNPTGVVFERSSVEILARRFPQAIVVVDEAYIEFCPAFSVASLVPSCSNLFVLRTFSKAFSLAGLRMGYLIANPHYLALIGRIKNFKEVNAVALVAAEAALDHVDAYHTRVRECLRAKQWFAGAMTDRGYEVRGDYGNFVLVRVSNPIHFVQTLAAHGIYVRDRSYMHQLNGYVRITIGTAADMHRLVDTVDACFGAKSARNL